MLVSHSYTLTAYGGEPAPFAYETLGGLAVAMFFVISGFLVSASWERSTGVLAFARNRALRIMPAYIGVVAVCAIILGPLVTSLHLTEYFRDPLTRSYFVNLTFTQLNYSLPGVFAGNPYPHAVNGSIWTLPIEMVMYVALAALGAIGLLSRVAVALLVAALGMLWFVGGRELLDAASSRLPDVLPAPYLVQLGLWFFTGSALWLWRDRIRLRGWLAFVLMMGAWWAQGSLVGRVLLHIALPYAVLWFAQADLGQLRSFGRRGDFSYGIYLYAFPVQQTFAHFGASSWPLWLYMTACLGITALCAVFSWHVVEAPALRLKRRPAGGRTAPATIG